MLEGYSKEFKCITKRLTGMEANIESHLEASPNPSPGAPTASSEVYEQFTEFPQPLTNGRQSSIPQSRQQTSLFLSATRRHCPSTRSTATSPPNHSGKFIGTTAPLTFTTGTGNPSRRRRVEASQRRPKGMTETEGGQPVHRRLKLGMASQPAAGQRADQISPPCSRVSRRACPSATLGLRGARGACSGWLGKFLNPEATAEQPVATAGSDGSMQ